MSSCDVNFPSPSDFPAASSMSSLSSIQTELQSSTWDTYKKFNKNIQKCNGSSSSDIETCNKVADTIQVCAQQISNTTNAFNEEIMILENTNKTLRGQIVQSNHNSNLSETFFQIYKENAAIAHIRNILIILGVLYLIIQIYRSFSQTGQT